MKSSTERSGEGARKDIGQEVLRLSLALKAMGGGVWDFDAGSGALYCNERCYQIMGIDPENQKISSMSDLKKIIHPDDVQRATEVNIEILRDLFEKDDRYLMKFRIIRPDGETRWLHSVACLMRDDADNIRAIGCITDVTHIEEQNALHPVHFPARNASAAELSSSSDVDASQIHLSDKERECLLWVSFGKTAWETAGIIGRSQRTVEFHLSNAIRKLNATNKVHAAVLAIRNGLL